MSDRASSPFAPQRHHRIDAHRPPRGRIAADERRRREHHDRDAQCDWIVRRQLREEMREHTRHRYRPERADNDPRHERAHNRAEDGPHDIDWIRAERL